jgi:hypothetical protein
VLLCNEVWSELELKGERERKREREKERERERDSGKVQREDNGLQSCSSIICNNDAWYLGYAFTRREYQKRLAQKDVQ